MYGTTRRPTSAAAELLWPPFEQAAAASPWFGWGVGAGNAIIPPDSEVARMIGNWAAHNEYLRISVEGGQLGRALLIGMLVLWVARHTRGLCRTDKVIMRLAFAGFAVQAYTDNVLIATTACVFFAFATAVFRTRGMSHAVGQARDPRRCGAVCFRHAMQDFGSDSLAARGRGGVGTHHRHRSRAACVSFWIALYLLSLTLVAYPAAAAGLAFVINSGGASISLVDMSSQKELRRIPVLREPHHLALSPDGRSLLVGDTVGNEMLFLDPATAAVQKRVPVADPYQLGFSPNGKFLVVNGLARNQVDVYDAADMQLLKRFPTASMPSHLDYAPDSSRVFVSLQGTDSLVAIDLNKLAILWTAKIGKTPAGVLWHDGRVLVADMGTDYVAVVDPADGRVTGRIHTGKGAHNLFLSPDWQDHLGEQPRRRHHDVARRGDADADPQLRDPRRAGRHRLRARRQAVDHAALGREGGGARSGDRRVSDDRGRPLAARPVPQPERKRRAECRGALSHA